MTTDEDIQGWSELRKASFKRMHEKMWEEMMPYIFPPEDYPESWKGKKIPNNYWRRTKIEAHEW